MWFPENAVAPHLDRLAPTGGARAVVAPKQAYWLFILFALYGPSINLAGEFRYVEIVVLALLALNLHKAFRYVGKWERTFASLFVLTAFMQVVSDLVNDASVDGTLKRSFTYLILALLVIGVRFLSRGNLMRLRWILAGYCLSYVTVLFLGQSASQNYEELSWRLGLGTAASLAICLVPLFLPRLYRFIGPILLAMSVVHIAFGARGIAILVAIAGVLATWGSLRASRSPPPRVRPLKVLTLIALGIIAIAAAYNGAKFATTERLFPAEIQEKMELQFSNPYGVLAAARPDTVAALYGITRQPLLGFGSTNVDPEVYAFYRELSLSTYIWQDNFSGLWAHGWSKDWKQGTPSHSHLFGAWVDAGVVAAISWAAVIAAAVYVLRRTMSWHQPQQPLFVLTSLLVLWDTLFSPGPIRMDVAIRLAILIYAMELLTAFDRAVGTSRSRSATAPSFRRNRRGPL